MDVGDDSLGHVYSPADCQLGERCGPDDGLGCVATRPGCCAFRASLMPEIWRPCCQTNELVTNFCFVPTTL